MDDLDLAAPFVPVDARPVDDVALVLAHVAPAQVVLPSGRRSRRAIHGAAEARIRETLLPA